MFPFCKPLCSASAIRGKLSTVTAKKKSNKLFKSLAENLKLPVLKGWEKSHRKNSADLSAKIYASILSFSRRIRKFFMYWNITWAKTHRNGRSILSTTYGWSSISPKVHNQPKQKQKN